MKEMLKKLNLQYHFYVNFSKKEGTEIGVLSRVRGGGVSGGYNPLFEVLDCFLADLL